MEHTQDELAAHRAAKEQPGLAISPDDLATLKHVKNQASELTQQLGALEYQLQGIKSQKEALMPKFAQVDREFMHHLNRIKKTYGIADGQRINEETGVVG